MAHCPHCFNLTVLFPLLSFFTSRTSVVRTSRFSFALSRVRFVPQMGQTTGFVCIESSKWVGWVGVASE
jgi:hypothetical protein